MPFGLINIGVIFWCAMHIEFKGLMSHSVVVYLNDVILFSKKRFDHLHHLKEIFERCWKYGISLNPKKTIFVVSEGKLLKKIISKDEIPMDPKWNKSIMWILVPNSKKSMQCFFGKINCVRISVDDFNEIFKPLQQMIEKWLAIQMEFCWKRGF